MNRAAQLSSKINEAYPLDRRNLPFVLSLFQYIDIPNERQTEISMTMQLRELFKRLATEKPQAKLPTTDRSIAVIAQGTLAIRNEIEEALVGIMRLAFTKTMAPSVTPPNCGRIMEDAIPGYTGSPAFVKRFKEVLNRFVEYLVNIQPIVISPTYVKRPLSDLEAMTAAANIFDYMDWRTSGTRGDVDTIMNDPANGLLRSRHPYFTTSPLITAEERSRVDDHIRYLKRVNDIEEEYPTGFERDMVRDVLYRRNGSTLQEYIKRPKHGDGKGGHLVPELRERLQSTVNGLDDYAASL